MVPQCIQLKVNVLYRKLKGGGVDGFVYCKKFSSEGLEEWSTGMYITALNKITTPWYISIDSLHVIIFVHIAQEPIRLKLSPDILLRNLCQYPQL
jgi:hypothetical protein